MKVKLSFVYIWYLLSNDCYLLLPVTCYKLLFIWILLSETCYYLQKLVSFARCSTPQIFCLKLLPYQQKRRGVSRVLDNIVVLFHDFPNLTLISTKWNKTPSDTFLSDIKLYSLSNLKLLCLNVLKWRLKWIRLNTYMNTINAS